jgi:PhnB protein
MPSPDGKITHADLKIFDSHVMLADEMEGHKAVPVMLYLYVADADATFKSALNAGATEVRPLENQFYGDRAGCVKDPCGNMWWIATQVEIVEGDELKKRADEAMKKMQQH